MYRYSESGLPYVYLESGYRVEDGPYGQTLAIEDVDGLHRLIASWIVEHLDHLCGREVRFLRLEMGLTQQELAAELGLTEQTVSLWERDPDKPINKPNDRLLRLIAEAWLDNNQSISTALDRLRRTTRQSTIDRLPLQRIASHWQAAA